MRMITIPEIRTLPEDWLQQAPSYLHVMAKPTAAIGNLDYKYWIFLSKEALCPGNRFYIANDLLETARVDTGVGLVQHNPDNSYPKIRVFNSKKEHGAQDADHCPG